VAVPEALAAAYMEAHAEVSIEVEQRAGGAEGDNIIKTRLATGEMADVFLYNAGSLFQALNPTEMLEPLDDLPSMAGVLDGFKPVVTGSDGHVYGVPAQAAMGGGILYNIPIYEELGLSVPTTWEQFEANSEAIKAAGHVPVIQTDLDLAALRAGRLLQHPGRGARLRRPLHREPGQVRRHARRDAGLRAPAGGLREELVERGLRRGLL